MSRVQPSQVVHSSPNRSWWQFRIWHLWLLSGFVAITILNIQDQRRREPLLIGLAVAGFLLYGVIGWVGWNVASRLESRFRKPTVLAIYLAAMSGLFLLATLAYLLIEHAYLIGF